MKRPEVVECFCRYKSGKVEETYIEGDMIDEGPVPLDGIGLCFQFAIDHMHNKGYQLDTWHFVTTSIEPDETYETIVAVFKENST